MKLGTGTTLTAMQGGISILDACHYSIRLVAFHRCVCTDPQARALGPRLSHCTLGRVFRTLILRPAQNSLPSSSSPLAFPPNNMKKKNMFSPTACLRRPPALTKARPHRLSVTGRERREEGVGARRGGGGEASRGRRGGVGGGREGAGATSSNISVCRQERK